MFEDAVYIREILEQGSPNAFRSLVGKYQDRVFTLCLRIVRDRQEAEEIAQDVFVKAFKDLHQLKDENKFINWLLSIAYSKAIDRVRKKRIPKTEIDESDKQFPAVTTTPLDKVIKNDQQQLIRRMINQLASEDASIITLFYLEELSVKEIAEITGLSTSNVKVKLFRARNSLRAIMTSIVKNDWKDLI